MCGLNKAESVRVSTDHHRLRPRRLLSRGGTDQLVVVGHYFIWHARVLTDVDMDAVVSGQQQVTVKEEHMNVAQVSHGSERIC